MIFCPGDDDCHRELRAKCVVEKPTWLGGEAGIEPRRSCNLRGHLLRDMSTKREFVARGRTNDEIAKELGADAVVNQTIEEMVDAVRTAGGSKIEFCKARFEGTYPTGDITEQMITDIEQDRLAASGT